MGTITSAGSGNWTSTTPNSPWPSGTVPTAADDVIIAKNHTITLDTLTCVANSIVVNAGTTGADVGGKLKCIKTGSSKITVQAGITTNAGNGAFTTELNLDMSSCPQYTCEIVLSNGITTGFMSISGDFILRGAAKSEWCDLVGTISVGATAATVSNATGWLIGDKVIFATTDAISWPPHVNIVTLTSVDTSTGVIGWEGGTTYAHLNGCTVGNMRRNVRIRPGTDYVAGRTYLKSLNTQQTYAGVCDYVEFYRVDGTGTFSNATLVVGNNNLNNISSVSSNAFHDITGKCINLYGTRSVITRNRNIFYINTQTPYGAAVVSQDVLPVVIIGDDANYAIFGCDGTAIQAGAPAQNQIGHRISGIRGQYGAALYAITVQRPEITVRDCKIWSSQIGINNNQGGYGSNNTYGSACFFGCDNGDDIATISGTFIDTSSFYPSPVNLAGLSTVTPGVIKLYNKNNDLAIQEIYGGHSVTVPMIQRDRAVKNRSTSAMLFTMNAATVNEYIFQVLAKSLSTIKILCYVRKSSSYGSSTLPKITISGLGITPVISSMSAGTIADTWELLAVQATNTGSVDGLLTVALTAQSATAGAQAWFSGLPISPFITRCRHYGYLFDETIPTRTADVGVTEATEATAYAYTGASFNTTTKEISFSAGTIDSWNKLYDYSRAWGCADVAKEIPFSRAGGACILTSGWTVIEPTLTDCTWVGGTIKWTTPGTKAGSYDSNTFNFTTAGSYNFGGATFGGTITLTNTSGGAVTVSLPAGTSYTNSGPNITVQFPVPTASVTITGCVTGTRVQLYDTLTSTELYNGIPTFPFVWSEVYSANRAIRLRCMYQSGATAKIFIDQAIGICTELSPAITYLVNQSNDSVHIANGIDGSTVTGVEINDMAMLVNVNTGSITWGDIYAYETYWLYTEVGIRDEGRIIFAVDQANYLFHSFKIKNISSPSVPCTITGGYGRDAATNTVLALIDTTGGMIFPAVDHVVNNIVTVGGANIITGDIADIVIPTPTQTASQVRVELSTELARVDASISTRMAGSAYVAPDNAGIAAIPTNPLLTTDARLNNIDATVSSRLADVDYIAPDNAGIAAIPKNPVLTNDSRLTNLDTPVSTRLSGTDYISPPTDTTIADAVWRYTR